MQAATSHDQGTMLHGQRVLITGGASGIGEACCRMFAAAGAYVVIADRNADAGKQLEHALRRDTESEQRVCFIETDVTSWASQVQLFELALAFLPGQQLDILIPCAGVIGSRSWAPQAQEPGSLKDAASQGGPSSKCLDIGLFGTMYSTHIASTYAMGLRHTDKSQRHPPCKSMILVGSFAGYRHIPGSQDYTVLKWGIRGLFRSLCHDLFPAGVRVNLLAPTFVATPLIADKLPALQASGAKLATMEDVVKAVKLLAVDTSLVGRALCVASNGVTDMCDDLEGFDGGRVHSRMVEEGIARTLARLPQPGSTQS